MTLSSFITILIAGVLGNAIWRVGGVALSNGLTETSPVIVWAQAVSKTLVAGLVARIMLFPPGALANVSVAGRVGAFLLGVGVFYVLRRSTALGILCGTGAVAAFHLLRL